MSSPKKKLPTGPIRISPPATLPSESSTAQPQAPLTATNPESEPAGQILASEKQDSGFIEGKIPEVSMLDSALPESTIKEGSVIDSGTQLSGLPEETREDVDKEESTQRVFAPQSGSSASGLPESGLTETEYKKVAMRLSSEAVDTLRQMRATTGVPYEILVDVMIRNWDKLPQRTRAAYLQQAKQVRGERLIAGQEKTMKTIRTKYLAQ